jgi:phosphoglycerol transferase MdoB-like AlkP superfamily enzyme
MAATLSKTAQAEAVRADWFANALGLAFIILKLCHVIDWSWWWVTAPFWAPLAVILAILLVVILVVAGVGFVGGLIEGWRER